MQLHNHLVAVPVHGKLGKFTNCTMGLYSLLVLFTASKSLEMANVENMNI